MVRIKQPKLHPSSFRDRDGVLFWLDGKLYRRINWPYRVDYELLMGSGLYKELTKNGLLVEHQEVNLGEIFPEEPFKVIKPKKVDFISYPYEWCFSQFKAAALATLRIQKMALKFGMSLKDASAFNIQFVDGQPILIDSLSFEEYHGGPWIAYRQFCQHFLNPLVLMNKVDPGLGRLFQVYLDGIPIDVTAKLLPKLAKARPAFFIHIQLHAMLQNKPAKGTAAQKGSPFNRGSMEGLIDSLEKVVLGLKVKEGRSRWSNYLPDQDSYNRKGFASKKQIVLEFFNKTRAKTVWDMGSNDGEFSRLVAGKNVSVMSSDLDPRAVEQNYLKSRGYPKLLPLLIDWTNPSPDLGWSLTERESILKRGPVDLTMVLALVHHLALTNNLAFGQLAEFFSRLGRFLIIEFVPKDDPQAQSLLQLKEDIFPDYTEADFERSFGKYFKIKYKKEVKSSLRKIYLMEVK